MHYRKFGNTDLDVSEIGFGTWAIGGGAMIGNISIGWGDSDDNISVKAIHAALDAGINFFDTADIYGLGHSEELLGKTIGKRKDVIIATKGGNVGRNNELTFDYSRQHIIDACEASLKRLRRNEIDFYQLHTARLSHLENRECIEAMLHLQKQGKIRYWGLSLNTFDPGPETESLMKNNLGNGFQLVLNLLNQRALSLFHEIEKKGYVIIARMPLQFGLLTGKFDEQAFFPENDHRKKRLAKEIIDTSTNVLKPVWELCHKYGCSKTELALSYVLSYSEVSVVIPGIRTAAHVQGNTGGLFRLDSEDKKFIEKLGVTDFVPIMKLIEAQG